MSQKFKLLLLITFFYSYFSVYAQTPTGGNDLYANMPYSRLRLGEIAPIGNLKNIGMGGTGVSFGNPEFINTLNPALLINNRVKSYDSLLTILEAAGLGQFRNVSNKNSSEITGNVNFQYFSYAIPVSKRWTTNIGIRPYSNTSYSLKSKAPVSGSPSDTISATYSGYGGIYQVEFANGVKVHKNLNVGLLSAFVFGKLNHQSFSQIYTLDNLIKVGSYNKISNTGFLFRPGVSYRKKLEDNLSRDSAVFFNVGLTYEFFANFQQDQNVILQTRTVNDDIIDQHVALSEKKKVGSPHIYRLGFSFDKYKQWNIAADFSYNHWSTFNGYNQGDTLKNGFSIALGGEWGFNLKKGLNERDAFIKKNYVRAGINYTKTPLYVQGKSINDISFSIGYSLPVGNSKNNYTGLPLPLLTTAIVVGQRGTHENNLLKDVYYKFYLGLTINDKWFRRRRVD